MRGSVVDEEAISELEGRALLRWMSDHLEDEAIMIALLRAFDGLSWKETAVQMNRLFPGSRPWTKRRCEYLIQSATNAHASSLRRLIGGV